MLTPAAAARAQEAIDRPATVAPGTPQDTLTLPSGMLLLPYGPKKHLVLYRTRAWGPRRVPPPEELPQTLPDTWAGVVWEEQPHERKGLKIIATLDRPVPHVERHPAYLLHASLSLDSGKTSGKLPSWTLVRLVKDALFGDVDACCVLPRQEDYVSIGEVLQLWQLPVSWGIR